MTEFRELLTKKGIDVYVLPRTDEYQSEYLCPCDERVAFLSGFTGSNGVALVSQTQALLWTDGRYFLQAENQLQEGWKLRKMMEGEKRWFEHLCEYPHGTRIEIDGRLLPASTAQDRKKLF